MIVMFRMQEPHYAEVLAPKLEDRVVQRGLRLIERMADGRDAMREVLVDIPTP